MEWYPLLFIINDDRMSYGNLAFKGEQILQWAKVDASIVAEESTEHNLKFSEWSSVAESSMKAGEK